MTHTSRSRIGAVEEAAARGYRIADGRQREAAMTEAFEAAAAGGLRELDFTMGGRPARLRCAGQALASIVMRPLAHLRRDDGAPPALTIDLWDEGETGTGCAECAVADELGIDGVMTSTPDGRYLGYRRARSMTLYDRACAHMVGWSRYADRACLYELGRPLHVPLSYWHADVGLQVMHAGLVASDGVGVLFPGMGGSGKSTSAITCLESGLGYLGDDYIGLERAGATFIGHSVYSSSHLEPHHLARFERLRELAIAPVVEGEDKSLILLDEVYPGRFVTSVRIGAIAMPRVVDAEESRLAPASKAEALLSLAPSSIVMIPGKGPSGMKRLSELVDSVPCFRLELGRRLESIPERVRDIVAEAGAA